MPSNIYDEFLFAHCVWSHDTTDHVSAHCTIHHIGPITHRQIHVAIMGSDGSESVFGIVTIGTAGPFVCLLQSDDVRIVFASQTTTFNYTSASSLFTKFLCGHAYVADIAVVIAMRFQTGVPPALESSITHTAKHSVPESPLEQNATSPCTRSVRAFN